MTDSSCIDKSIWIVISFLPGQYLNYPKLAGRGIVEITNKKGDGSKFSAEAKGDQRERVLKSRIHVAIDGYATPLIAVQQGKFSEDVLKDTIPHTTNIQRYLLE